MKWAYSTNEENYYGDCDTREEAIAELFAENPTLTYGWVGQCVQPMVEGHIDADAVIEQVICTDEYGGDWADDALCCTKEQRDELTDELRKVFGAWVDRHDLRPEFFNIENAERVENPNPMTEAEADAAESAPVVVTDSMRDLAQQLKSLDAKETP